MLYHEGLVCVEEEEEEFLLYTSKNSKFIYVVQFLDDCALVRSASPMHYNEVHKIDLLTFTREFEEYCGDHEIIRQTLMGMYEGGFEEVDLL